MRDNFQNYDLRKAILEDAISLSECIDNAYAKYTGIIKELPNFSDGIEEDILSNEVWVLTDSSTIIAGLILMLQEGYLKLANIAIHPDWTGKGIGRYLLEFAEKRARDLGYSEMRLNTHMEMTDNISLYHHLGWKDFDQKGK
ncbi:GNAT family N-acetyltransferase, partial [Curvivirga aplysinae]|uniref:GNAT family N-acetyltransferase n=1 Tax=Curvivirga aplysinae TaxID=2529852 RepID=UPI0012BBFA53